ncbi:hypothetical protein COE76_29400, partial [Bacillus pseudomycoides]
NWQTFYLKSAPERKNGKLALQFMQDKWGTEAINPGNVSFNMDAYFNELPYDKQRLATITTEPVSKAVLESRTESETADMEHRMIDVLTQHKDGEYSSVSVGIKNGKNFLQDSNDGILSESDNTDPDRAQKFKIIPIEKGSNKVLIDGYFKYIPTTQVPDSNVGTGFTPSSVWTLEADNLFGCFWLKND